MIWEIRILKPPSKILGRLNQEDQASRTMQSNINYWAKQITISIGDLAYLCHDIEPPRDGNFIGLQYNDYNKMPSDVKQTFITLAIDLLITDKSKLFELPDSDRQYAMIVISLSVTDTFALVKYIKDTKRDNLSYFDWSTWTTSPKDVAQMAEDMAREEAMMLSFVNTKHAKHPRQDRQHKSKPVVKEYWDSWQAGKITYDNDTAFINAMMDKTGVTRANTIRDWIKEWKSMNHG